MGNYDYSHQCGCDSTVLFTLKNANAQTLKNRAANGGGRVASCSVCGCYWRVADDGIAVSSGGGVEAQDEGRPKIDSLPLATSGPASGSTTVRIAGHAFRSNPVVKFGGVAGTGISIIDEDTLDVDTPAGAIKLNVDNGPYVKIAHGSVTGGPFQVDETITGGTSSTTAVVKKVGSGFLLVGDNDGEFTDTETLTGGTSSAEADVTATTRPVFEVGETVTGETSGETGTVSTLDPLRVTDPSGAFTAGEDISGGTSAAMATLDGATPMDGAVDVTVENDWGQRETGAVLAGAFTYTA
jgi:hypothetical protein